MLKIFSTQLSGIFKKITEQEEMNIEDGARLLAQALTGDGSIHVYGTKEMHGILAEALYGQEPLPGARVLSEEELTSADRILLISRFSDNPEIVDLAKKLQEKGHFVTGISALKNSGESLEQFTDVHIDIKLVKALIPDEDGSRFGFPSLMAALFAYYGLKFTMEEIMRDY